MGKIDETDKRSVFVEGSCAATKKMFKEEGFHIVSNLEEELPDFVCFTDGKHVSPMMYGCGKHDNTDNSLTRDEKCFQLAVDVELTTAMVGFGRGAHFLNAYNGGTSFQMADYHRKDHYVTDVAGNRYPVESDHDQVMCLPKDNSVGKVLLKSYKLSTESRYYDWGKYEGPKELRYSPDIEAALYAETNSLCYQPNPAKAKKGSLTRDLFFALLEQHILGEI